MKEKRVFLKRGQGTSRFEKGGLAQLRASALEKGVAVHNAAAVKEDRAPWGQPAARPDSTAAAPARPTANGPRLAAQRQRDDSADEFRALEQSIQAQTEGCWPSEQGAPDPFDGGPSAQPEATYRPERQWSDGDDGGARSVAGW